MDVNVFPMCQVRASSSSSLFMGTAGPFNSELPISVGTAGPQLRAPDLIGHGPCRTSTARARPQRPLPGLNCKLQILAGAAGPQRSQWALPGLDCELQISVGPAESQLRAPDLSWHAGPQLQAPDLGGH